MNKQNKTFGRKQSGKFFTCLLALIIGAGVQAARVHQGSVPSFPYFNKDNSSSFAYLEAESTQTGTFSDSRDTSRTFFGSNWYYGATGPSSPGGTDGWYPSSQSRIVAYGNTNLNLNGANAGNVYWENLAALNLAEKTYEVWVYTWPGYYGSPSYDGSVDFNFYGGTDKAAVDSAVSIGTLSVAESATDRGWYYIGDLPITADMDTFRLKMESYNSSISFDAIMFVVPEPASCALLAMPALLALQRRKRR